MLWHLQCQIFYIHIFNVDDWYIDSFGVESIQRLCVRLPTFGIPSAFFTFLRLKFFTHSKLHEWSKNDQNSTKFRTSRWSIHPGSPGWTWRNIVHPRSPGWTRRIKIIQGVISEFRRLQSMLILLKNVGQIIIKWK